MPLAFRTGLLTDLIFYTALFMDLSTAAFAAAVYLRIINTEKNHRLSSCHQIKNSPLKTISVPPLELSNALLLASLMHFAHSALNLECHCWMDSAITLAWLSQLPSLENLCRQSCFGCAITPSVWSFVASYFDAHQSYELRISWSRSQSFRDTCFMVRPFMASSSRVLAELMPSDTLQCFFRTTLKPSICTLYTQLGFCVALFFVGKIATNYRLSVSFSKSTMTL